MYEEIMIMRDKLNFVKMMALFAIAVTSVVAPPFLTPAFAQSPHFIGQPTCSIAPDTLALVCEGSIGGLGSATNVEAFLVADFLGTFECTNPAGNVALGQPDIADLAGADGHRRS
jgi:hypothetical protein